MSFVSPAVIPDADFRERWASHEWENKIAVRGFVVVVRFPLLRGRRGRGFSTNNVRREKKLTLPPPSLSLDSLFSLFNPPPPPNSTQVATDIPSAKDFLKHVAEVAHMKVLTPPAALAGECRFLAANLYARSRFGEDALLNLAVEEGADGRLAGAVRIRSKTQGMALSVGDVLILKQKGMSGGCSGGGGSGNAAPAEVEVK